jgi:unspecific monooxygenase
MLFRSLLYWFSEGQMRWASNAQCLSPSASAAAAKAPSGIGIARALGENALLAFPPEAFENDFVIRRFFGRRRIILNQPAAIQQILIDNSVNYRRTTPTMRMLLPLLGRGLLLSDGADWKEQRRIVAPAFGPRTIPALARQVSLASHALIGKLMALGEAPVDLLAEMRFLTLEVAGRVLFSMDMDRHGAELRELITLYGERLGRPTLLDFLLPAFIPSPRDFARRRFRHQWMKLIARIICDRCAKHPEAAMGDLFHILSEAEGPDRLVDQVATMITAGHETTAAALFWALLKLATTPEIQQRVAAEAGMLGFGPEVAAEALPKLVYTRAVVQETLRLYPPAFALVRQAKEEDVAGDISIPAGDIVFIAPWVLHRHRRLWAQPEQFDPSRFLPGAPPPDRFAYLPFGIGPRVCIGAQFALTEATLVLAALIQAFRIERASEEPVTPVAIITTQPDHPPLFRLFPRSSKAASRQ